MNILLVDADSTIPNLALMKLSTYHKAQGDKVTLIRFGIPYLFKKRHEMCYVFGEYDKIYCSVIFEGNKKYIGDSKNIIFGGTGIDLTTELSEEIENLDCDYSIYPENKISYGFITRGCIRNCYFCKVPKKEGMIRQVSTIEKIVKHKQVKFMDNNILAFDGHLDILKQLAEMKINCEFNQGLDIRLLNEQNAKLLSIMNYSSEYTFALDNWKLKNVIIKKLPVLKKYFKEWSARFFVYVHPDMPLSDTVNRIEFLRKLHFLPYIMRDKACFLDEKKKFYNSLNAYCNSVMYIKAMDFKTFIKDYKKLKDANKILSMYYDNLTV